MKKNGLIELYRFVFACIIVLFHGAWIGGGEFILPIEWRLSGCRVLLHPVGVSPGEAS